jgi:hypothetical protein
MAAEIEHRLEELESLVREQQETIETQRERIAELEDSSTDSTGTEAVDAPAEDGAEQSTDERDDEALVSRRGAVKAGGLLALAGVGAGAAGANPTGQVGTSSRPLSTLYTQELRGVPAGNGPLAVFTDGSRALELGVPGTDGIGNTAGANVLAGSPQNNIDAGAVGAVIAGGGNDETGQGFGSGANLVRENYGTIGGGEGNSVGDFDPGESTASHATVCGGRDNRVNDFAATVGGGSSNFAGGSSATVGGGQDNRASDLQTTVGGGNNNRASGTHATVGGGNGNRATSTETTVGGGRSNTAGGEAATVPGGRRGAAESFNSFVWNDSTPYHGVPNGTIDGLSSDIAVDGEPVTGTNTFSVSAQNGVRLITGGASSPNVTYIESGGTLVPGGNAVGAPPGSGLTLETDDGSRALELGVPTSDSFGNTAGGNVLAGSSSNSIDGGAVGAVVSGGGSDETDVGGTSIGNNVVSANYGTVGGGEGNTASGEETTVGGGSKNTASGDRATVGGGSENRALDRTATVGGGVSNEASGVSATVGGGNANTASARQSTVGGGNRNTASALQATVPGGSLGAAKNSESFVWNDGTSYHAIPNTSFDGLSSNTAVDGEPVTGSSTFSVSARGGFRFITGSSSVTYIDDSGTLVPGGNAVGAPSGSGLTLETDDGSRAIELGVPTNDALGRTAGANVLAGSPSNSIDGGAVGAVVAGGGHNGSDINGNPTGKNVVSANYATIGGGNGNTASSREATVGGGNSNTGSGLQATVGGGKDNTASGEGSTVPGGIYAAAQDQNSFVWNDGTGYHSIPNTDSDGLSSQTEVSVSVDEPTGANTFSVSATGGVRFITGSNQVTFIEGGTTGWATASSRAVKTNIDPVDPEDALDGVESLDVATWEYTDENGDGAGTTHIGPMAEEFHEAFDVGSSDAHINSINADGVAFAAIQGLAAELDETRERLDEREQRIADLETEGNRKDERIDELERRLADLEDSLASHRRDG